MKSIESLHVKTWIFLAVFSAILLVVGSISSSTVCQAHAAGGEFRVGICTSFKMECGTATRDGALLAAEEINARGGILGNKIRLIYADTEDEPEKGITALKRLVEKDKVHVLIGAAVSGVFLAQMDFLQPYNIIFMNTGASTPIVADKLAKNYEKYKYQFRTTINSLTMGKSLVEDEMGFMMKMGFKKFAIFAEDAAWNRGLVNYLQKGIPKLGGNITTNVNFDPQTIDFAPIFSKISASGAEVAVPLFALTDTIAMYKQYRDMKPPFRMAGYSNPGLDADYWEKTAGACLSEVNLGHHPYIPIAITPKSIPFYNKFRARFKSSPTYAPVPLTTRSIFSWMLLRKQKA